MIFGRLISSATIFSCNLFTDIRMRVCETRFSVLIDTLIVRRSRVSRRSHDWRRGSIVRIKITKSVDPLTSTLALTNSYYAVVVLNSSDDKKNVRKYVLISRVNVQHEDKKISKLRQYCLHDLNLGSEFSFKCDVVLLFSNSRKHLQATTVQLLNTQCLWKYYDLRTWFKQ